MAGHQLGLYTAEIEAEKLNEAKSQRTKKVPKNTVSFQNVVSL